MLNKDAHNIQEIVALNIPKGWDIFKGDQELSINNLVKTASKEDGTKITVRTDVDLNGFNLDEAIEKNPNHLFVKVFAIKKDEPNDNGDAFSEEELIKGTPTFIGVPVFCNHKNDDIEKARGKVVHAWYDKEKGGIWTINMVDSVVYPKLARGIEEGYITGCFPPDAPVTMADGSVKNIVDIEDGDLVISGSGNIKKVLGKRQRGYKYPLYKIFVEGIATPIVCTAHHNIISYKLRDTCACGCGEKLASVSETRLTAKKFNRKYIKGHGSNGNVLTKQSYLEKIKACELKVGDFLVEPKFIDDSADNTISEDQSFLIGLFLAEGSFEKRSGVRHSIIFNFAHTELETLADHCVKLIGKAFPNHKNAATINYYPGSSQTRVCVYGKDIAEWFFKYCGEYSDNKKMHPDLLKLGKDKTAALIAGYIEGDGYRNRNNGYGVSTVSKNLSNQVIILCNKLGIRTKYRKRKLTTGYKAKTGGYTLCHEISFGKTTINNLKDKFVFKTITDAIYKPAKFHCIEDKSIRKIKKIEEMDYDGIVYDIEVEDDHTYLVNGISVSNSSMGCVVSHSACSICHMCASTSDQYCDHVKNQKTRRFSGKVKCQYSKSKHKPYEECPICKKNNTKEASSHNGELVHNNALVYEHNFGLKFIEDSFVVNPACHDCLVDCVLNKNAFSSKVAQLKDKMEKIAREEFSGQMLKVAGVAEIGMLNKAMKFMEVVAKSMMDQKDLISMEYLSDIVEVLASTQTITDELIEMGYPRIASPATLQDPEQLSDAVSLSNKGVQTTPNNIANQANAVIQGQPQTQTNPQQPVQNMPPAVPNANIGTITKPPFMPTANKKIEDFIKLGSNVKQYIDTISQIVEKYNQIKELPVDFTLSKNGITVVLENADSNKKASLRAYIADQEVKCDKISHYQDNLELFNNNKDIAALEIIEDIHKIASKLTKSKEFDIMDKQEKTAAGTGVTVENQSVTTEKQLEKAKLEEYAGKRQENAPTVTTQGQLEGSNPLNSTTTDSPQQRVGDSSNYTTELQLEKDIKDSATPRWKDFPEVVTEKQWDDFSRAVGAVLSESSKETVTQSQLADLRKNHRWTEPNVTTEGQLSDTANWLTTDSAWLDKKSSQSYAKALVVAATNALSDAIAYYKRTPSELVASAQRISQDPQSQIKAAFLVLVNGLPNKKASRKVEIERSKYFGKVASITGEMNSTDALLACMGDHCLNLKAEDLVETVKSIALNKEKMAKVEELASAKLASKSVSNEVVIDKASALEDAFKEVFASEVVENTTVDTTVTSENDDGLYQVQSTVDEIGVPISDKIAFSKAAEKFAQKQIENTDAVLYSVEVDEENGTVATTLKEASKLTSDELAGYKKFASSKSEVRKELLKQAQMMGGEQPAGLGAGAPGAGMGASLPTPPAGEAGMNSMSTPDMEPTAEEDGEGEPKPPGSICPVCGSEDVDIIDGKGKCNNCGAEFDIKVQLNITKYPGLTGKDDGGEDSAEAEKGLGTTELGSEMPTTPIAAMTRLSPNQIKKLSSNKTWAFGKFSPITGSSNTHKLAKTTDGGQEYLCLDTGSKYSVHTVPDKNDPKSIYAEWRWTPKVTTSSCSSCSRSKNIWKKALAYVNLSNEEFDSFNEVKKANTVQKMIDKGLFAQVKTASKIETSNVITNLKNSYASTGNNFPYDACLEKLSNRFGQNAVALSGPNKGDNLAECVCNQLKSAKVYSNELATKLASVFSDTDGCKDCIEFYVRKGFDLEKTAKICDVLKLKYASFEHILAEAMTDPIKNPIGLKGGRGSEDEVYDENELDEDGDNEIEMDFDSDEFGLNLDQLAGDGNLEIEIQTEEPNALDVTKNDNNTLTIELPLEAVQALDTALDTVLGPNDLDNVGIGDNSDEVLEISEENEDSEENKEGLSDDNKETVNIEENDSDDTEENDSKEENDVDKLVKESDESEVLASYMKRGKHGRVGEINLDLSHVIATLKKQAGEVTPKLESAQDVAKDYSASNGSVLGEEEKFKAEKPKVERNKATIGNEEAFDAKDVKIPKATGTEGNLKGEEVYKSETTVNMSGGDKGSGTSQASSKKNTKVADSKVTVQAPQDTVKNYSNNKDHSLSGVKRTPHEEKDNLKVKETGNAALIKGEKDTIKDVPKANKNAPTVPSSGKLLEKEVNEQNKPELTDKVKGSVAASDNSEAVNAEAFKLAGKLVEAKLIDVSNLKDKVSEFSKYSLNTLKDLDKSFFSTAAKVGLTTESDGVSNFVPVASDVASDKNKSKDLVASLQNLYKLTKQVESASKTDDDLRKIFN